MLRERILTVLSWWAVIALSTWVGGTLYQMLVIVPIWSAAPPESVRAFFEGTEYNRTIFHFFGPPFMAARTLPLVAALAFAWNRPRLRAAWFVAVICFGFGVAFTALYIYPINAVLFEQAGGQNTPEAIRAMAARWVLADRVRFAVGLVGFFAVLWAFRQQRATSRNE